MYNQHRGSRPFYPRRGGHSAGGFIDFARAPIHEIRQHLSTRGLDVTGSDGVLRSRLQRNVALGNRPPAAASLIEYLVVIDFEASCTDDDVVQRPKAGTYEQEIIEFPAILVDVKQRKIVDIFHSFVQPTKECNRKLTGFCSKLTSISQETVDKSPTFPVVFHNFELWLAKHNLLGRKNWCTVTDGSFDHTLFMYQACLIHNIPYPDYALSYLKLPRTFKFVYRHCFTDPTVFGVNLAGMLEHFGLTFEGKVHCGKDDATNLARVALKMLSDGVELRPTDRIHPEEVDNERPFCCKTRCLEPGEWEDMQKAIIDPTYVPKERGCGDGRPLQEIQNYLAANQLDMTGSEGVQRSRVTLHETWVRFGRQKSIVYDFFVVLDIQVTPALKDREIGSYVQPITWISAAIVNVEKATKVSQFSQECQTPDQSGVGQPFSDVWRALEAWMQFHGYSSKTKWCVVVNSRHALPFYLYTACAANNLAFPQWALLYMKLDALFKKFYPACCHTVAVPKLPEILENFTGSSAKFDSIIGDLTSVCIHMIRDKAPLQPTDRIHLEKQEGPSKPFSRIAVGILDREWQRMRQEIVNDMTQLAV